MTKPVIIIGGGGHAKVLVDCLNTLRVPILGVTDPKLKVGEKVFGVLEVLGSDDIIFDHSPDEIELVNGLGSIPGNALRTKIFREFDSKGYTFKTIINHSAIVSNDSILSDGAQVMAGAIIQPGTVIENNVIINTGVIVDHDCIIGENSHIAPGAVVSGGVHIGSSVHIGTGATIIHSIEIGENSIVGAGAVITKNVGVNKIVYPARSVTMALKEGNDG
ncbi:MAG: acetyltransferase [Cycloclasticus sp.]